MRAVLLIPVVAVLALTACSPTVSLPPAEQAADPLCAEVTVTLPDELGTGEPGGPFTERATDAQATSAWGEPTVVTLRCGVPEPEPTTDPCATVEGVDWIEVAVEGSVRTFVTYGRSPSVELIVDTDAMSASTALTEVSRAVGATEEVGACIGLEDAP